MNRLYNFTKDLKILYVEDNDTTRESMTGVLLDLFKEVIVAVDGSDALTKYDENKVDIILTDINMPKLNGIEMIRKIRETNKKIPILVLSAYSDSEYFLDTIRLGIDGYIIKPISSEQLLITIGKSAERISLEKENEDYKHNLEVKVKEEISKREYQEKILIQQSKLAAMGEMVDAVAHQWKQPLNLMMMNVDMLQYDFEDNLIDDKYIKDFIIKYENIMTHTIDTLDEFRSFFRPNTSIEKFSVENIIDSTLLLVKDEFVKNNIKFIKNIKEDYSLDGNKNELKHLILNLINNSKDAFIGKEIKDREITINMYIDNNQQKLEILDNAGGIPSDIINGIFKPNFTTKSKDGGTGIGLYISKQIAEKFNATLDAKNIKNGVLFIFSKDIERLK